MYNENLRPEKEQILCEDGTYTLYSKEFDEPYHSTKDGALHESLVKHVIPSLKRHKDRASLVILDICFGLGYNTLATLYYVKKHQLKMKLHILSPEFDEALIRSLSTFNYPKEFDALAPIIQALSQNFYYEDAEFKIEILRGDARKTVPLIQEKVDIVYQDAFSPTQNPLLWTREFFTEMVKISNPHMTLTTYSTSASVRLGLYESGFLIFLYRGEMARSSTLASQEMLEEVEYIDMELKKLRNPTAKSLRDRDYGVSYI